MIAILGGGISGLAAAYQLQKEGVDFVLLEADKKLGGKIQSISKDGFHFELGPNTVLLNNPEIMKMIEDLGLNEEIISPDPISVKNRFVLKNGQIEAFPSSLPKAIKSRLFGWNTLLSIIKEPFKKSAAGNSDESLADFTRRRLGSQILNDFIAPFVTGIYAGDPEKMSATHSMGILKEAEQKHGSILKGMPKIMKVRKQIPDLQKLPKQKIFTFQKGLHRLIEVLKERVSQHIITEATVDKIIFNADNSYTIHFKKDGENHQLESNHLISALPANVLANLLKHRAPKLSHLLASLPYVGAISLNLSCDSSEIDFNQKAFGLLSRKEEGVPFLGVLFNSRFFPMHAPKGKELITVICGGYRQAELIHKSDEEIHQIVDNSLKTVLGIREKTKLLYLQKWKNGIPQYELGHAAIVNAIDEFESDLQSFTIIGNFKDGISVSDCIAKGINKVKTICQK